jgi:tetratricopeptide (TPR) repeat protein
MNRSEKRGNKKLTDKGAKKAIRVKASLPIPAKQQQTLTIQQAIDLGVEHHNVGRLPEAESIYQQILQAEPNQPAAMHLLGLIAHQVGKNDIAVELIGKALAIIPDYAEAHNNLGNALKEQGKIGEAICSYHKALAVKPDYAEAHYNLGWALQEQEEMDDAVTKYRKALDIKPDFAEAHNNIGNIQKNLGMLDDAVTSYLRALAIMPDYAAVHNNLGNALLELNQYEEAVNSFHKAISIKPDLAEAHNNIGNAYHEQGNIDEAVDSFYRALAVKPDYSEVQYNLGNVLMGQHKLNEAITSYRKALAIEPDHVLVNYNMSLAFLLLGQFDVGWPFYEWRWKTDLFTFRNFNYPIWDGSDLATKRLLVWMEQGVGDEIMFASMLTEINKMCEVLFVECESRLLQLFRRSFNNIKFVSRQNSPHRDLLGHQFDFHTPIGNLATHLRKNAPSFPLNNSYLCADEPLSRSYKDSLTKRWLGRFLVGISWRTGSKDTGKKRSIQLEQMRSILTTSGCQFINLQYGDVEAELASLKDGQKINVFSDTSIDPLSNMDSYASFIAALDLVISIDNSTVHLSGSLGVPTWTLLPFVPDWRWMLERTDTPWYPSMRLFRQDKAGDWDSVIENVRMALIEKVSNRQLAN